MLTTSRAAYEAIREHLVAVHMRQHSKGSLFEVGTLQGSPWRIAIGSLPEGGAGAAVMTERATELFTPDALLSLGVARSLRDGLLPGDVVVATRLYSHQGGAEEEGAFLARPKVWEASHRLDQLARHVDRVDRWADPLPAVHFESVATGEVESDSLDSAVVLRLRSHYEDTAALDIEGAGMAQAGHLNDALPVLAVRGIVGPLDASARAVVESDGRRQESTAARNAALFALALVRRLPAPDPGPDGGEGSARSGHDVLVSCRPDEVERMSRLVSALESAGLSVRVLGDGDPGADGDPGSPGRGERIRQHLPRSRALVILYSSGYQSDPACARDLMSTLAAIGPEDLRRLVVINPEPSARHVQPGTLRTGLFATADQLLRTEKLANDIVAHLRRLPGGFSLTPSSFDTRWIPHRRLGSAGFVGRVEELWKIHSSIRHDPAEPAIQVCGLGGVGKTLLAEEYALRFAAAYPGGVFWFDAYGSRPGDAPDAEETLGQHLSQVRSAAEYLRIDTKGMTDARISAELEEYFSAHPDPFLWVVDDLPGGLDERTVGRLLAPHQNGRSLVTTRFLGYGFGPVVDTDVLSEEDGYRLLTSRRSPRTEAEEQDARELVRDLGMHALALDLAGVCITDMDSLASFADLRAALRSEPIADFDDYIQKLSGRMPGGHARSIAATLVRSVRHLDAEGIDVLNTAAVLAAGAIRADLFADILRLADDSSEAAARMAAATGIRQAQNRSLARVAVSEPSDPNLRWLVHTLVRRTVVHHDVQGEDRRRLLRTAAVVALHQHLAAADDARAHPGFAGLVSHARSLTTQPESLAEAALLGLVSRYDYVIGDYRAALDGYRRQWRALNGLAGAESVPALEAAGNVAVLLEKTGDHRGAAKLDRFVLDGRIRTLGENHPQTLITANNLALDLREAGLLNEACEAQQRVVSLHRNALGDDHPQTISALANLAIILCDLGAYEQALEVQRRVYSANAEALGADHTHTLLAGANLSSTLRLLDHLVEALEIGEEVLRGYRDVLGDDHPATLDAGQALASTLGRLGRDHEALALQQAVWEKRRALLGEAHTDTLRTANNLSLTLRRLGRLEEAKALQLRVAAGFNGAYGTEHPRSLVALGNLAFTLRELGQVEQAAELERRVLKGRTSALGAGHPDSVSAARNLSATLRQLGRTAEAELVESTLPAALDAPPETGAGPEGEEGEW
ncbi:FxSxx-COOH system tetratricopeptide repeat protein [Streptacidiphilus sp. N1-3]|uniref:FxSxx-COOH system tetratricopeptide repeat protein n=1 Tax=Streptacidiphilus alkalitolerans TaxID=3342712 RepID=A0ABV6XDM7_9ACTN